MKNKKIDQILKQDFITSEEYGMLVRSTPLYNKDFRVFYKWDKNSGLYRNTKTINNFKK